MDWQLIFNALPDPAMILDLENRILEVNEKTVVVTGMSSNELIGRYCYEIFHGQPVPPVDCPYKSLLASQKPQTCSMTVEILDKICMISVSPLFNASGEVEKVLHISRDITEQRMAEQLLLKSEEKFRMVSDFTHDWEYWIDPDEKFIYVSPSVKRITGYTVKEFYEDSGLLVKLIHPDGRQKFVDHKHDELDDGELCPLEFRIITKAGDERWISHGCQKVYAKEGEYLGVRGSNRDITERVAAEFALKESEEKYRRFFSTVPNGWAYHEIVVDENNRPVDYVFIEVNEAFEKLTGLIKEDIIGKRVTEVLPGTENDPAAWIDRFGEVAQTGKSITFENYSEAIQQWFTVSASCPTKGYFIVVFEKISKRKQAEEALAHSYDLMSYIIEHTKSAIAVHDNDLKYVYASQHYLDEYNVKELDVIGKHHYDVFPDLPQKWRDVHQKVLAGEVLSAEDDSYIREDGSVDWTRWECRPWYQSNGSIGGLIVYTEVITERKKQEAQKLKLSQQQEELKRLESLKTMAGAVAHRFNNSMTVVLGNLQLLEMTIAPDSPEKEGVSDALQVAREASQVGSMMLTYVGQRILQLSQVNLVDIVKDSLIELKSRFTSSITLKYTLPPEPLYCSMDSLQIKEVISAVLINAVESLEAAIGTIEITFGSDSYETDSFPIPFQADDLKNGLYSFCQISDTGSGISEEDITKIFEPFFTTKFVGRGLGLALTVGVMRAHHGALTVASTPGQGTTVKILLPVTTG